MKSKKFILFVSVIISALFISCSLSKGSFGYKTTTMDGYRKLVNDQEFDKNAHFKWVYDLPLIKKKVDLGVIVQKKELVWVDVQKYVETATAVSPRVYGSIDDFEEGEYRIVLIEMKPDNKDIYDEVSFRLISFEDEY